MLGPTGPPRRTGVEAGIPWLTVPRDRGLRPLHGRRPQEAGLLGLGDDRIAHAFQREPAGDDRGDLQRWSRLLIASRSRYARRACTEDALGRPFAESTRPR